jgi:hypothetical protein
MGEFVVVVTLPGTPEHFTRSIEGKAIVGREEACDIHLQHPLVSRRHLEIEHSEDGDLVLRDLGSKNGTLVQNQPLAGSFVVTSDPTTVQVGPYVLSVSSEAPRGDLTMTQVAPRGEAAVQLDRNLHTVSVRGEELTRRFSPQEFKLLEVLELAAPRAVRSEDIGEAVWGAGQWDTYMLHNLVRRVRRRFEDSDAPAEELLVTVPGVGYLLA